MSIPRWPARLRQVDNSRLVATETPLEYEQLSGFAHDIAVHE
jgi:hypothetical protein